MMTNSILEMENTQLKLLMNKSYSPFPSSSSDDVVINIQEDEQIVNSFTCDICVEPIPQNKEFKNYKNDDKRCSDDHQHRFCSDCIAKYIEVKVEDLSNATEEMIKCPGINCDMVLDPLSCRSILPEEVFVRWCAALCESVVLYIITPTTEGSSSVGSHNRRRVYCPFPDCSELILNECDDNGLRRLGCPNCKKLFCFQCQITWGESHRCNSRSSEMMMMTSTEEEINIRDRNDILFLDMVKRNGWAKCPTCN